MGFFKKLVDAFDDYLNKSVEDSKKEANHELVSKSPTSPTPSTPRRNSGKKTNAEQVKKQEETVKQPKKTSKATKAEQSKDSSSIEPSEKVTKGEKPVGASPLDSIVKEAEPQSTFDEGVFSAKFEALINSALQDGVLTEQEKAILKKRAEKEGEDWDEVEMIVEARLAEMKPTATVTQVSQTQVQPVVMSSVQESPYLVVNGKEYKDASIDEIDQDILKNVTGLYASDIMSVTIPSSVKEIKKSAFISFYKLKELVIPSSVERIGDNAFGLFLSNMSYEKLHINCPIIPKKAFNGAPLKEVILGGCVNKIEDRAFANCEELRSIKLPHSIIEIGKEAFEECSNLQIVDMSQCTQLEKIGTNAFRKCKSLSKLLLPKSLKEIGEFAFEECSNLQIVDMSQCNSLEMIGENAFSGCSSAEFVFPEEFESLKCIYSCAFENCKKITSFPFSKALNKMNFSAFKGCSNLQILDFSKCTELWDINYGIIYCKGLDSLKKIILPPSQTEFNALCVWGPNVHIGEETNQVEVDISHCNFKEVSKEAFQTMDLKEIIISDTVETIGENAFDECKNLKTIVMPAALKEIKAPLGSRLEQLKKVDFSKVTQLRTIPKKLFDWGCYKLKELVIPQGVTEIEDDAFEKLDALKRLFLPPTLKSIGDLELTNVSIYCFSPSLEELEPIVYGWDDDDDDDDLDDDDLEGLDEEDMEELKEEKKKIKINLFVLPQYVEKYISQRNAERIPEDVLIIKEIPEEFRYYYDN